MDRMAKEGRSGGWALIAVATATGISIIALAYFSKRVFQEPISDLYLAVPPFLATFHQLAVKKASDSWVSRTSTWVAAILLATALIVGIAWN